MNLPEDAVPVAVDARSPDDAEDAVKTVVQCHAACLRLWGAPSVPEIEDVDLVTFTLAGAGPLPGLPRWLALEGIHSVGVVRLRESKKKIGYVRFHDMPADWS